MALDTRAQDGGHGSLLLVPYVVPAIATAITWRWMFNDFYGILSFLLALVGLLPPNTSPFASVELAMPTAMLVSVWRGFPFAMIVFWAALQAIPQQQYEAARVNGQVRFKSSSTSRFPT